MIIHQLLHGYNEGHRLLSGSIIPEGQSAKTIMALSDLGGQGDSLPKFGYVTGYPVPTMKMYAFAHTWLAPEMSRPGCVWTHTLLIDFSDLALINDLSLLSLFERPKSSKDYTYYSKPLQIVAANNNASKEIDQKHVQAIMEALYGHPQENIFVYADEDEPTIQLTMTIWLQQWPKLRRSFRFCTWVPHGRSRSDRFDLQFVPYQRKNLAHRNLSGIRIDIQNEKFEFEQWTNIVINNFKDDVNDGLRSFLWKYGAESDEGRAAFIPLVTLWDALKSHNIDFAGITQQLKSIQSISSLMKRMLFEVAEFAAENICFHSSAIEFLLDNLHLLDEQVVEKDMENIVKAIWRHSPKHIWTFFRSNSPVEVKIANYAAQIMMPEEVLKGTAGDPELFANVIKANQRLAASSLIWDAPTPIPQMAAWVISRDKATALQVLPALFESNNPLAANIAVELFGYNAILIALEKYASNNNYDKQKSEQWLFAAKQNPEYLSRVMTEGLVYDLNILEFFSTFLYYNTRPYIPKIDEWAKALGASHKQSHTLSFNFSAFLMARALSGVSPEPGVLIIHSFDSLHTYLLNSEIDYRAWGMLNSLLPEVPLWDRWDKGYVLRLGVVKTFINRHLPFNEFISITKDSKVYKLLVKTASSFKEGRSYMTELSTWANSVQEEEDVLHLGRVNKKILYKAKKGN